MPARPEDLFQRLDELEIKHQTTHHPALHTVEESQAIRGQIPGAHNKNLFLRDKKKQNWLVCTLEDKEIDLKQLAGRIGAGRLSFGSADRLAEFLGVMPGAVTAFALINDPECRVKVVLDGAMLAHEQVNFHPLVNTMTTTISAPDLLRFVTACGHQPQTITL
ncbi:MAG: prolyl-tRNA synthetase associated domain-containing protein [Rhodospirillaceae bacterium]|nr:prolyl-tRNA synthetase associated domain-containing protein [Rhodospirillaceae bacterium]MBT5194385.1 prolyl-tRNA synthetase associated domain-containing protein [Rhodospirillaceae bacterium]MBT5897370.1 prolyl-tRNA synthetase associated domain-containing protein [Rhodospirillaceae bacterium]MBT6427987.1 prolyl-tRNA synthetase associated domain-containing protein [Rhodospirillaceae bacterium]MBT7756872.1 prolyl-tRNA synthetase associated domain-containing protein [Rhodospirillaceae bacterium